MACGLHDGNVGCPVQKYAARICFPVVLLAFCGPAAGWSQDAPPNAPPFALPQPDRLSNNIRVRLTIAGELSARDVVAIVDPSLPTDRLEWRADTIAVWSGGRLVTEVPRPGRRLIGAVVSSDAYRLTVRLDRSDTTLIVPWAVIGRFERHAGDASRLKHAGIGALVGATAGAGLALVAESSCDPQESWCFGPIVALPSAALSAGIGALVGVLLPPNDRWVEGDASSPQEARSFPAEASPRAARIAVTISTGAALTGGPAADIERAMRAAGYDGTSSGCFIFCTDEPIHYPRTHRGLFEQGRPLRIDGAWSFRPGWAVHARWQQTPIGMTTGMAADSYNYVDVAYRVTTMGVVLSRDVGPWRIGLGPARHRGGTRGELAARGAWQATSRTWGYVADAGLRLPTKTRAYFDLGLQYAGAGRVRVGPFVPSYGPQVEVPAMDVSLSHWSLGMGGGLRF